MKDSLISGEGVYSRRLIKAGEVIEICPVIKLSKADHLKVKSTVLYWYYFLLPGRKYPAALALGFGSVYNHSCPANARFTFLRFESQLRIEAVADIEAGAEITINYNGSPFDNSQVTFQHGIGNKADK